VSQRVFEFRPGPFVLLAYAVAPAASITLFWLGVAVSEGVIGRYTLRDDLAALSLLVTGASIAGLLAELFLVTPVLLAFRRYRWNWLNAWWATGYGLAIGEVGNLLLSVVIGPHHWFGWGAVLQGILVSGFVGAAAAFIFQFIAFRRRATAAVADVF